MDLSSGFEVAAAKRFFLEYDVENVSQDDIYSYARVATVQRGYVYQEGVSEKDKFAFWGAYRTYMDGVVCNYSGRCVADEEHLSVINNFIDLASADYSHVLNKGLLRFGSAQKLINLTLKYLWVIDKIDEPPHVPVDSYVANNVGKYKYKWTGNNSSIEYMDVIERCRHVSRAYGLSLAQWELLFWNISLLSAKIK